MGTKKKKDNMVTLSAIVPKEVAAKVRAEAERDRRSVSAWISILIENHFQKKS